MVSLHVSVLRGHDVGIDDARSSVSVRKVREHFGDGGAMQQFTAKLTIEGPCISPPRRHMQMR